MAAKEYFPRNSWHEKREVGGAIALRTRPSLRLQATDQPEEGGSLDNALHRLGIGRPGFERCSATSPGHGQVTGSCCTPPAPVQDGHSAERGAPGLGEPLQELPRAA